jgi:hypothetical protein
MYMQSVDQVFDLFSCPDEWRGYRLGDGVRFLSREGGNVVMDRLSEAERRSTGTPTGRPEQEFGNTTGGTLLHRYMEAGGTGVNGALLTDMIRDAEAGKWALKGGFTKARPDVLVLHLRLGDLLFRRVRRNATSVVMREAVAEVSRSIAADCRELGLSKAVIVAGSHRGAKIEQQQNNRQSAEYLVMLRDSLRAAGIFASLRIGNTADSDFAFLVTAKHFQRNPGHPSGGCGGFGMLASICNRLYHWDARGAGDEARFLLECDERACANGRWPRIRPGDVDHDGGG